MSTDFTNGPGYRYFEYLLVLQPHEDLRAKIVGIKKDFQAVYNTPTLGGKPHIVLAKFVVWGMMEERIVNRLRVAAMGTPPFKVAFKNFGSFPSHTIYLNTTTSIPIQYLMRELRTARHLLKSGDADPYFITEPFLTIARNLTPLQFQKAWHEYAHRSFTGSFVADSMLLIRRQEGEKFYQIVQRLEFSNLPVNSQQGSLFL
ncbi:MAG: 2'-5' RNA ligase family protein [Williamsia sp.]|nr:2'-5' RNA ligase family protein [Williamsia sp.]